MGKFIDLTGQKFGMLTVLSRAESRNGKTYWNCICDCGAKKIVGASELKQGNTKSCGCNQHKQPFEDITGQKFGRLTAMYRVEGKGNGKNTYWHCICDCGNEAETTITKLRNGHTISCGCYAKEARQAAIDKRKHDLTGQRFGRLVAIKQVEETRRKRTYWLCQCDCGNTTISPAAHLLRGSSRSCGCINKEIVRSKIIECDYTIDKNNTVHAILRTGEEMLCDLDDWERLKNHCWRLGTTGYAECKEYNKGIKFHIEVMGKREGLVIDHINRNKLDNRKCNLRFTTETVNHINSGIPINNSSGVKGVAKTNNGEKWQAYISVNKQRFYLGNYDTIEEAAEARRKAEEKYHKPLLETKY